MIRKTIYITLTMIILGGAIYLATYAGIEHRQSKYHAFSLRIANPQDSPLVTEEELLDTLAARFGPIEGNDLNSVSLFDLELFLSSLPYVFSANVFSSLDGGLSATVVTRVPLIRVFNLHGETFILDTAGVFMPVSPKHPVRLPVASGEIETHYIYRPGRQMNIHQLEEGSVIRQIYQVATLMEKNEFIQALVGQVYVNEESEIEFIPKIGRQVILFGTSEKAAEKMEKLTALYTQVMVNTGWDTYKTINLTFDNQVVCTK